MNPIINLLNPNSSLKEAYNLFCSKGNPYGIMQSLCARNPQLKPILNAISNGQNPQVLFYELCKQRNIDPNEILNQLK